MIATISPPTRTATSTTHHRILALDAGNYDLKYWSGQRNPKAIRSMRYQLPTGRNPVRYNDTSPLIELPDGKRYHFGMQAYKYRRQQQTVVENKIELSRLHLYACIESAPPDPDGTCRLSLDLHLSTPDPDRHTTLIRNQLLGPHEFIRNDIPYELNVETITIEREGLGAYRCAQRQGIISPNGYTIVIDLGGGTWLSRLIDSDSEVIDENVMDRGGSYDLAASISFDHRLTDALGTSADPGLIMDGFRMGHTYADSGHHWRDWLDEYLDPWYKNIFRTVKSQYTPFMPHVTKFLVTGGSSHLIADRFAGFPLFTVMPDPQFANVRGLYPQQEDLQLCMTH